MGKKKKFVQKLIAGFLALAMSMSLVPAKPAKAEVAWEYVCHSSEHLSGTINKRLVVPDGATIYLDGVNVAGYTHENGDVSSGVRCRGNATIVLSGQNKVIGGGISVDENKEITIESANNGSLEVTGSSRCSGIGGGNGFACGTIRIKSGTILAKGGDYAPGIGTNTGNGGNIYITGGDIQAIGGYGAAGIESGQYADIRIKGGIVYAKGGEYGSGIECGKEGSTEISGGIVTALGGKKYPGIAASGLRCNVNINGGMISATGGEGAAGIGGGQDTRCYNITITSGVTRLVSTKGTQSYDSIGSGRNGSCSGKITIGGVVYKERETYKNGGDSATTGLKQTVYEFPTQNKPAPSPMVDPTVTVSYLSHIQNIGWNQGYVRGGMISGTSGKSYRLEAIKIRIAGNSNLGIQYTTHVQDYGWMGWSRNDELSGTEGESKRLEAIKIQLTGKDRDRYDVFYRVHAQNIGWMNWAKNGAAAGTAGYGYRLEAIQIVVVKKGTTVAKSFGGATSVTSDAYRDKNNRGEPKVVNDSIPNVTYRTHVQNVGWQSWKTNGGFAGTSGKSYRLEGIQIKLTNSPYTGTVRYRTHIQNIGWSQGYVENGAVAGTSGRSLRLEAINVELTGEVAKHYDIYYRVHAQNYGWLGWAKNGEAAGTAGKSYRLEGIQIVIVEKGGSAPVTNYNGIQGSTVYKKPYYAQ